MKLIKLTTATLTAVFLSSTFLSATSAKANGLPDPQNIAINEVYYLGNIGEDWVELVNRGPEAVDISGWRWCAKFQYPTIGLADIIDGTGDGDLLLEPGEIIALSIDTDLNDTSSDLGLYTTSPFGTAANMVDFVQWGTNTDIGRSDVAVVKDIWIDFDDDVKVDDYDFVPTATNNQTLSWCGSESDGGFLTTSMNLTNDDATQGAVNPFICDLIFADDFE